MLSYDAIMHQHQLNSFSLGMLGLVEISELKFRTWNLNANFCHKMWGYSFEKIRDISPVDHLKLW